MHTITCRNVRFHYNSDLSGNVTICNGGACRIETHGAYNEPLEWTIEVDGEALKEFVAEIVRNQRIEKIEQMDTNELLGLEE